MLTSTSFLDDLAQEQGRRLLGPRCAPQRSEQHHGCNDEANDDHY